MPKCKPNVEKSKDEAEDTNVEKGRIPVRIGRRKRIGYMNKMLPKNGNDDMHNLTDIFQKMLKFYMTPVNQQPAKPPATKPLTLFVSNIPTAWSYDEVKQFIEKECGNIQEVELIKSQGPIGTVKVKFFTHIQLIIAKHELVEKEIDGRKLTVDDEKVEGENSLVHPPPRKPYVDAWSEDPEGLYGLRLAFLHSLNITPPISKRVHVFNFKCCNFKLKELLKIAGRILLFNVQNGIFKCAKVTYSHPLEAVQAISMFNGRTFYGLQLGITMDKGSNEDILPHGLRDLGPGLGKNGKPVINIAVQYDRLVKKKSTLINSLLFVDVEEYTANAEGAGVAITGQNNQPMPSQNVVINPFNLVQDSITGVEIKDPRPAEHVPGLPIQNFIPPHAPNLMHDAVTFDGLPNIRNMSVPPTNMLQNANMLCNPLPQTLAMAHNALQPQGLWHNNEYQQMPPVPSVPNRAIQTPMPDSGMIPNMDVAQNQDWQFISQPPPTINALPNGPHDNVGENACATECRRGVIFQNVPNPMKLVQHEPATVAQNNVLPNVSNPIIEITPPEIRTTVVLNNIPPSTLNVLLERLNKCGKVISIHCPYQRCAVVTFATPQQAERCILMYNGYMVGNCGIQVTYA